MTRKRMSPEKVFAILDETVRVLKQRLLIADMLADDEFLKLFKLKQKLTERQSQEGRQ
jgi:hypothetical protein